MTFIKGPVLSINFLIIGTTVQLAYLHGFCEKLFSGSSKNAAITYLGFLSGNNPTKFEITLSF
tara:strand:+ start:49 stop:237 length:189 start_codon:yes stop_codon:yes gene_type:complete